MARKNYDPGAVISDGGFHANGCSLNKFQIALFARGYVGGDTSFDAAILENVSRFGAETGGGGRF